MGAFGLPYPTLIASFLLVPAPSVLFVLVTALSLVRTIAATTLPARKPEKFSRAFRHTWPATSYPRDPEASVP